MQHKFNKVFSFVSLFFLKAKDPKLVLIGWLKNYFLFSVSLGTIVEVGDKAKDHGSKEIRQSVSEEELSELLLYLPAQNPTWK